jgi:hypothetical protein
MDERLRLIVQGLDHVIGDPLDGRAVATYETGANESLLIGTEAQLLSFAKSIIESVIESKSENFWGEEVLVSDRVYGALDPRGAIAFDWIAITENDEQKDTIFSTIYRACWA